MSKIIVVLIIVITCVPFAVFLLFGKTAPRGSMLPAEDTRTRAAETKEANPEDTAQCALCRQIQNGESQTQCLQDFACST